LSPISSEEVAVFICCRMEIPASILCRDMIGTLRRPRSPAREHQVQWFHYANTLSIPDAEQLLHLGRIVQSLIWESQTDRGLMTAAGSAAT
jgi:hypothetical protein